jgi:hypothetical protein
METIVSSARGATTPADGRAGVKICKNTKNLQVYNFTIFKLRSTTEFKKGCQGMAANPGSFDLVYFLNPSPHRHSGSPLRPIFKLPPYTYSCGIRSHDPWLESQLHIGDDTTRPRSHLRPVYTRPIFFVVPCRQKLGMILTVALYDKKMFRAIGLGKV